MKANFAMYNYLYKFISNALKCWKLPLSFFVVFFMVSLCAANQAQDRYCDEALVIVGTRGDYLDKEVMIEDPYVSAARLNVEIAATDNSISGISKTNLYAFDFSKRRIIAVSLKGNNPRMVRVALEKALSKLSSVHDEKYAQAVADYDARLSYLKKARINLEKIISNLSSDRSIPVEAYQNLQVELIKIKGTALSFPKRTRIVMPDNTEAKSCETKTKLEMMFYSVGWGFIGSLMAMFSIHISQTHFVRGYKK